jgi:ribonuclease HI
MSIMANESIVIFTDGGCSGNPGPGGWAYVLVRGGEKRSVSGAEAMTTNNRMELKAVISGLEAAKELSAGESDSPEVAVYTDSQYVKNGITTWIVTWKRNGWRTSTKAPVKNQELWTELDALTSALKPSWHWVKGHAGNELNEECDRLTQEAIASLKV